LSGADLRPCWCVLARGTVHTVSATSDHILLPERAASCLTSAFPHPRNGHSWSLNWENAVLILPSLVHTKRVPDAPRNAEAEADPDAVQALTSRGGANGELLGDALI
jgi:hypothetical protein